MSDGKTQAADRSVEAFISSVEPKSKRDDAHALLGLFTRVTGKQAAMWGPSIVGFGSYHYRYESGREGDWMRSGFSPRKARHSLYLMGRNCDEATELKVNQMLARMGKHKTGASCIYVNKLADIDLEVLEEIIAECWRAMERRYPEQA